MQTVYSKRGIIYHLTSLQVIFHLNPSMNRNDNDPKANMKSENTAFASISSEDSSGMVECRLCRESNADACFEPCGHAVVCIDCAPYFCKCFVCEVNI